VIIITDEKQCCVHDRGSVEHGSHEDIVTGAIDKTDVTNQIVPEPIQDERVLLGRPHGRVTGRPLALGVVAAIHLCVGVTQLDGDVPLQLILESYSVNSGQGFDDGRFTVSHVADGSDVDGGLAADDLR